MAWCIWREQPIQIVSANLVTGHTGISTLEAGRLSFDGIRVSVAVNAKQQVQLITVKPAGKPSLAAIDWYRGITNESDLWLK
jgi:methionyl-tRNA formyltransferase